MRITHRSIEQHLVYKKPLDQKKLLSSREEILKTFKNCKRVFRAK